MERIPILKMGEYLLVTIQVDMHDRLAMTLQDDLTDRIVKTRARGVLIDISALEVVDSFIGRMLGNIASMARVLDAETVVVGMRPAVAITLVELGLRLGERLPGAGERPRQGPGELQHRVAARAEDRGAQEGRGAGDHRSARRRGGPVRLRRHGAHHPAREVRPGEGACDFHREALGRGAGGADAAGGRGEGF